MAEKGESSGGEEDGHEALQAQGPINKGKWNTWILSAEFTICPLNGSPVSNSP